MGTEDYWQKEKQNMKKNEGNIHPDIAQTYADMKSLGSTKHFKQIYLDCLQGALNIKQWEQSDNLTVDDMGMLICRDVGCELTLCQNSMADPYERPFSNCDAQFRNLNRCIASEIEEYEKEGHLDRTMQEQIKMKLEKRKKEKYFNILQGEKMDLKEQKMQEKEYIIRENKQPIMNTKL